MSTTKSSSKKPGSKKPSLETRRHHDPSLPTPGAATPGAETPQLPDDPKIIREIDLEMVLRQRESITAARADLRKLEADLEGRENAIIVKLRAGAVCEGKLVGSIENTTGEIRPQWKDLYISHMVRDHAKTPKVAEEEARAGTVPKAGEKLAVGYKK